MARSLQERETQRAKLLSELGQTGDMRRGSINEVYRRCGKANCCCADPGHPGHGPFYAYTVKVAGKTKTLQLRPGALLSKLEREVAEYKHFRATSERVIEVNEQLCNARPDAAAEEKKHLCRGVPAANRGRGRSADRSAGARPTRLRGDRDRRAAGSTQDGGVCGGAAAQRRPR